MCTFFKYYIWDSKKYVEVIGSTIGRIFLFSLDVYTISTRKSTLMLGKKWVGKCYVQNFVPLVLFYRVFHLKKTSNKKTANCRLLLNRKIQLTVKDVVYKKTIVKKNFTECQKRAACFFKNILLTFQIYLLGQ